LTGQDALKSAVVPRHYAPGLLWVGRRPDWQLSCRCPLHILANQWIPGPTRTISCCRQWLPGDFMVAAEGEQPHWEQRVRRIAPETVTP
jgi:hypothetical protein